jgi:VIT1/CCC1 family predicted Fe2+/Mn2+ transporter
VTRVATGRNELLRTARIRTPSRLVPGEPMTRAELAGRRRAVSMALGEYVSVSSQRDTELAAWPRRSASCSMSRRPSSLS